MRKLAFLCVIVLVVFVVGCSIGREDLFELAGSVIPDDGSVTEVVDVPDLYPEITVKSASGTEIPVGSTYPFPDIEIDTYMTQTFIIENIGDADLVVGDIVFIDRVGQTMIDELYVSDQPISIIMPGELTTFDATFDATLTTSIEGTIQGLMVIGNNDAPYIILINPTVTVPTVLYPDIAIMMPDLIYYESNVGEYIIDPIVGTPVGGEASVVTVTVSNTGTENLLINNILVTGKTRKLRIFVVSDMSYPIIVSPLTSITFDVLFSPDDYDVTYTTKLKINSNDPDEDDTSFVVNLTGTGVWE